MTREVEVEKQSAHLNAKGHEKERAHEVEVGREGEDFLHGGEEPQHFRLINAISVTLPNSAAGEVTACLTGAKEADERRHRTYGAGH